MSWKDRLRPASFKGKEFFVDSHETEIGRRLVVNEYPYRDEPYTEDMGASARRYTIDAYVIGSNYMESRDAILDAVEAGGPGVLVHPFLGTLELIAETVRLRETKAEGGYAILSISFVPAGTKQFPSATPIPSQQVGVKADELLSQARDVFINGMTVTGVSEWIRSSYGEALGGAAEIFSAVKAAGGINGQTSRALINQAAEWVADVAELSSPSISLIKDLAGTADRIIDTLGGIFDLSTSSEDAAKNLQRFSSFTATRDGGLSTAAQIADNNAEVVESFVRTAAAAVEAKATVARDFPSYEEAIEARSDLLERLDTLAGATLDDGVYDALRSLRTEVAFAVPGEENDLPRLSSVQLKQSLPSLVIAYDLYETVDEEQQIIDRNKVRHPGFLPGGRPLSVLEYDESPA